MYHFFFSERKETLFFITVTQVYFATGSPLSWKQLSLALILSRRILIWHLKQTLEKLLLKCISASVMNSVLMADSRFCHTLCVCCVLCFEISHSNKNMNSDYQVIAVTGLVPSHLLFSSPHSPDVDYIISQILW